MTPIVHDKDAWLDMKRRGYSLPVEMLRAIHMPRNTGTGVIIGAISIAFGFAMVWYMWWLVALSLVSLFAVVIGHSFNYDRGYEIAAKELMLAESAHIRVLVEQG